MRLLKPHEAEGRQPAPSAKDKARILDELCAEQDGCCYLCGLPMTRVHGFLAAAVIEHVVPGKMGRNTKQWSRENLKASCVLCNLKKGSRRDYLVENGKAEL